MSLSDQDLTAAAAGADPLVGLERCEPSADCSSTSSRRR